MKLTMRDKPKNGMLMEMMQRFAGFWLVGSFMLVFYASVAFAPPVLLSKSSSLALLHRLAWEIPKGHLNGVHERGQLPIAFSVLQPGDIILCHNRGGGYGFWTHSVIYVGGWAAVDADDFAKGCELDSVNKYRNYDGVAIFRPRAAAIVRNRAVAFARREVGKPYDPFSGLDNSNAEYCSKLIWRAYQAGGLLLAKRAYWIVPDDLAHSRELRCIGVWGEGEKGVKI